jgi:hypothetical protein
MEDTSVVVLTLALKEPGMEADEVDDLTRRLLREIRGLSEVDDATLVADTDVPVGSKAFGGVLLGMLQAQCSVAGIKALFAFLRDRLGNRAIEMELRHKGKSLVIKAGGPQEFATAMQAAEKFFATA